MERAVFKRETIQLKYMPKVEKRNAQDKSSQGRLSRQIANLKQNLKHTTENTMALDTTIEARRNEINNISNDITNEKQISEDVGQGLKERQLELLQRQILKQKSIYESKKVDQLGNLYGQIATGKSLVLYSSLSF